jgi:hypothetical protein
VIRRVLVLTAQVPELSGADEAVFRHAMLELGVLTGMVLVPVRFFDHAAEICKTRGVTDATRIFQD